MENGLKIRTKAATPLKTVEHPGSKGGDVYNDAEDQEEPLSPYGHLYHTKFLNTCIMIIFGFADKTLNVDVMRESLEKMFSLHPRFFSRLVKERWVHSKINYQDHVVVPDLDPSIENTDRFLEDYVSDLSSTPFDLSKPLWEFHALNIKTSYAESVGVFKIHHSIGDGMSLISLVLSCSRKTSDPEDLPSIPLSTRKASKSSDGAFYGFFIAMWLMLKLMWNTLIGYISLLASIHFLKDTNALYNSEVDECSRKKIVYRLISLDDLKLVKNETNVTINDVVLGVTAAALSRYLHTPSNAEGSLSTKRDYHKKKLRLRAAVAVNIRKAVGLKDLVDMMENGSKCDWGNTTGCIIVPIHVTLEKDQLEYVRRAKHTMDQKKLSLEAKLSFYTVMSSVKLLGIKWALKVAYGVTRNLTLMFSTVVGPVEEIDFCGHRVTHITPAARTAGGHPPGVVIHFMSYMNKMSVAVCANQDLIPDGHELLDEVEESLRLMKHAVLQKKLNKGLS
ncbi:Wax ester synthase/diacylglycerol acyltransferase 11-like protein [Drosera capensis]